MKAILSSLAFLLLTSCTVGPDFSAPEAPNTHQYTEKPLPKKTTATEGVHGGAAQEYVLNAEIPAEWWELYHSPELNSLIEHGLENSPNLQSAKATLTQAEENLRALVGSTMLPMVSGSYAQSRQQTIPFGTVYGVDPDTGETVPFFDVAPGPFNLYNATVNVSYTLDVFGGNRRAIEASKAQVDYQRYELAAAYLTLTANIVTTAVTEASIREQIRAVKRIIAIQEKQLNINRTQHKLGSIASTAILAQEAQLAQSLALLPPLENNLAQARNALAVLVGDYPGNNQLPKFELKDLHLPTTIPVSLPSRLIRQRPDVQAAEALLHASTAQIGVATANLLPDFPLTASAGSETETIRSLFASGNNLWMWQAQVVQTIFNGGALLAQRKAAIAAFEAAYAQYQMVVLTALQNVSNTLQALEADAQTLKATALAEQAAKKTLAITQKQYAIGGAGYLEVLNAEYQYQQASINRIMAEAARYADTAALFQAMGGGWWKQKALKQEETTQAKTDGKKDAPNNE